MGDHHFEKPLRPLAFMLLAGMTFQPSDGYAKNSISDIDQQIQQLESKAASAKQEQKRSWANKQEAQHYKNKTNAYLKVVLEQINVVSDELASVSLQIENTEEDLRTTKKICKQQKTGSSQEKNC